MYLAEEFSLLPGTLQLEAGVFLRAMGFTSDTPIYVAAMVEHLYPSEKALEPLRMLFPRTLLKRDLLTDVSATCHR